MWPARRDRSSVTCPACGASLLRTEAREYDKFGDRWERDGKTFEYLCKTCHSAMCHQPRPDLESLLCDIEAGSATDSTFLRRYVAAMEERTGAPGE